MIMNYKWFILISGFTFVSLSGQVGINTQFPQGTFHVDGNSDNVANQTISMQNNDFLIKFDGKVGMGTDDPTAKLHIKSENIGNAFRLADGTEGDGKLLSTINLNGDVIWKNRTLTKTVLEDGNGFSGPVNTNLAYVSRKVTLEPGKWIIKTNLVLSVKGTSSEYTDGSVNKGFYARFCWADYNGTSYSSSTDALSGNIISGLFVLRYGVATGLTIINNSSAISKTYYLTTLVPTFWGGFDQTLSWYNIGAGLWNETSIIVLPAN
jgi:hypothetical protein